MAEAQVQIIDVVRRVFSNWTALRMAVEHGMGSRDEARCFCDYVAEVLRLNDQQMHYTDLSIELEEYLDQVFNTQLEDDSEKQVAQDLVRFHLYMLKNEAEKMQTEFARLPSLQPWLLDSSAMQQVDSDSESDDMDTEDDKDGDDEKDNGSSSSKSKGGMEVDEDGFTVVRKRR